MKLKLDDNLGLRWVARLRDSGHDVDTVHDEGLLGGGDGTVLGAAVEAGRALVAAHRSSADADDYATSRSS